MSNYMHEIILEKCSNILENKEALIQQEFTYQLYRTLRMFKWNNLPETIPQKDLEILLQINGHATFTEVDGRYYVFKGGLGGRPNVYFLPTISVVANPALNYSKSLKIGEDCVVILNDPLYIGLTPLFNKYAGLIAETFISLRWAAINSRVPYLIDADNDTSKADAEEFLKKIVDGSDIGVIAHSSFYEGIKTHEYASKVQSTRDLLEMLQYIKAHWFNDLGIQANYNMKREAINSSEVALNEDALVPAIDEMLEQRKIACKEINKLYGLNISVELSDVWQQLRDEMELAIKKQESEISEELLSENTIEENPAEPVNE